ncbi:hypothetical protein HP456_04250 [Bacillus haikouensis]|uniref:hypothetical protein n=1 Tax=Bacillus haikouensis TaxID=1510468 RepID=UPI001551BE5E|nr:hypothetical protein [Bacillus haikouensis]NQD65125.1 hypothetical protein [Bacillus haikouensis]
MKKLFTKVAVITIILTFVIGGAAGALVYHVNDAAKGLKKEYGSKVASYFSERDDKIKNDVQGLTTSEIKRLKDETNQYLNSKISEDYQRELNQKSNEISQATDQKIIEIKDYVDKLMKGKDE